MNSVADQITAALSVLIGQELGDCWRAADMQIFEFGPRRTIVNRKEQEVDVGRFRLHIQCHWRMADASQILFGRGDLFYPADENISVSEFDYDKQESVLDRNQRQLLTENAAHPARVVSVTGDAYGGFRLELDRDLCLEAFPCCSDRSEYSEQWRLIDSVQESHFVATGYGIEGEDGWVDPPSASSS